MKTYRTFHHLTLLVILSLVVGLASAIPAYAQSGGPGRQLSVGDIVTGTLDSQNFVQTFTLPASEGDTITIDASTDVAELALVLVLTDERGNSIAQDTDTNTPTTATLPELVIPTNGTYYILVMRGSGAEGTASGTFTLKLSGTQQVGGQTVALLGGGLNFQLAWNAAVNLNMEVRDPVGGTVHAFSPGSPSGGILDADVNGNCDAATATAPTETIAWAAGDIPAGSYEVIIYYFDGCAIGGSQVFSLSVDANGEVPQTLVGTLLPGQQYVSRVILESDGSWSLVNGGVNAGLDIALFRTQIANADPIAIGSTVSGLITNNAPARAYKFDALAGTTVDIQVQAQSGSLDTYLVLIGPDNTPLVSNDDADENSTDSGITRSLAVDGSYTVLVTRYGLTIGGTEGEYALLVTTAAQAAEIPTGDGTVTTPETTTPTEVPALALPNGAIEIELTWLTNADLQLLVRDPVGASVYDDFPSIPSGGALFEDGNVGCTNTTSSPVSYIYWPPNRLQPGTYEIEVWYQSTCNDITPVNFGLRVDVLDQTIINTTQPISADARYMVTFKIEDQTATAGPGGFFDMANANSLNYQAALATAIPIDYQQIVTGSITEQQRFVVYRFEGQVGDVITTSMNNTGGILDPALYLISPDGIQIAFNDDVTPVDNPDSVISEITLPTTGSYYIIATHYGLHVGGTQGTYELTLFQE
ncbi:MAG: PPC domain-containing protein [Anaerolineae bacterium]|nr:PPC domain-containing protein [Anaerolineae bacterium]